MRLRTLILSSVLLLFCYLPASGQQVKEQESKRDALEKEIAQLEKQIAENTSRRSSALNELTLIRKQMETRQNLVNESSKELSKIRDSIRLVNAEINLLQERMDTLSLYFSALVKNAYRNRDARVWYVYILSSNSFGQAARRYSYLRNLSKNMNAEALRLKEIQDGLQKKYNRLDSLQRLASNLNTQQRKELSNLQAEEKRSNNLVSQLQRNRTKYQKELDTKRKQVQNLNREIEKIIDEYMKLQEAEKKRGTAVSEEDYRLASEFESNKGKLPWPADGPVLENFGIHYHPVYTNIALPFNNGISIGLSQGSEIKSVFDGEVKNVIVMPGYNMCVLISHGSYFTFYCKLGRVLVKAGDKVSTGTKLGTVDTIDGQTQLHFQIWNEKEAQNPETWLRPKR